MAFSPLTPRHTVILLLATQAVLALALAAALAFNGNPNSAVALGAAFAYGAFLIAYQHGWEPARHWTVILVTLLLVAFLPESSAGNHVPSIILIPPVLALVLTSASWIIGVSTFEYVALILRDGIHSPYLAPSEVVLFTMVIMGLVLSRKLMEAAVLRAAAQREHAEAARREAERRTQEVLAQSERLALLAQLLDEVDQGILASDSTERLIYVNRAARELAHQKHPLGLSISETLHLETAEGSRVFLREAAHESHEWILVRPDGAKIPVLVTQSSVKAGAGFSAGSVTVCTDVSRIKRLEEDLHHAQRLDGIGRLAGGVAHDFNNLLTVIGGAAAMAQRALPQTHQASEDLDEILMAVDRASELTRQLLAFARKQVLLKRPVDISELVLGMERMLRRVIGEHIKLETSVSPEPLVANADAGQIEQVILNLAINARDAMQEGGTLSISTVLETVPEGTNAGIAAGRYARLEVSDSGFGMSEEVQARVFEPFFTTKTGGRGTGLGLATCFGIIKQHDGHIRVESARGRGTRMLVLLPAISAVSEEVVTQVRALPRGAERVLLVEDDPSVRRLVALSLSEAGYRVTTAAHGREGLARLGQDAFDVLVSDVVMPELSGPELVRLAREREPELAVVLISGYADSLVQTERGALEMGVFVQKPFTPRELVEGIQRALLLGMTRKRRQG